VIFRRYIPDEPLARFIDWFWFYQDHYPTHQREHVLTEGTFELVIDLRDQTRKLFDGADSNGYTSFRGGWLSGAQARYIIIDALPGSSMIGVHFKPGGAAAFLDMPADELRDRVVEFEAIWGNCTRELRERLLAASGPDAKFRVLQRFLLELFRKSKSGAAQERRVSWALERFVRQPQTVTIRTLAHELGISHKHFIHQFRTRVGLPPKLFCRIRRFQQVLAKITSQQRVEWADIAYDCGYFDQSHFIQDFHAFSGLNPTIYISHDLEYPNFVPVRD
jgi:AraC-like DNA-binding protein